MDKAQLVLIDEEIKRELSNKAIAISLLQTTFKGLTQEGMMKALFEGMVRGFLFKDFLEKNVYAVPFGSSYSLITSIDYSRKIAMRSGLAGKSAPVFEEKDGKIISCMITVKRNVGGVVGEYTAKVFFQEYNTGRNLWLTKPHTMIAKVAEMQALRAGFPEEMAKQYIEEEMQKEMETLPAESKVEEYRKKLESVKSMEELKSVFSALPVQVKVELEQLKNELKVKFQKNADTKISRTRRVA